VFAVRAGPILKENLIAYLLQQPLTPHKPQQQFLGLLSTGDKYAIASRGDSALEGEFLWKLKDQIDRTWMEGYQKLPSMHSAASQDSAGHTSTTHRTNDSDASLESSPLSNLYGVPPNLVRHGAVALAAFAAAPMRCGGCGAKVGATTVSRVLEAVYQRRLRRARRGGVIASTTMPTKQAKMDHDDGAVVVLPKIGGGAMIHTIDFFRSFISDPFVFGKIAAIHALSDCHAMGAQAQTVLALAVVPFAAVESITESTLVDMLSGASDVLEDEENCELAGGHTCEGAELSLGFAVNGFIDDPSLLLRKRGGRVGDKIVLTKPIGTGALFAADMRARCEGVWVQEAIDNMLLSNGSASRIAMDIVRKRRTESDKHIHACTDVTGFGLIGHLLEMLLSNDDDNTLESIGACLDLEAIPFLDGALDAISNNIYSSLQVENARNRRAVQNHESVARASPVKYNLLFDPQTAGGLLFFVSPDCCNDFVAQLSHDSSVKCAAVIGEVTKFEADSYSNTDNTGICTIASGFKTSGLRLFINY